MMKPLTRLPAGPARAWALSPWCREDRRGLSAQDRRSGPCRGRQLRRVPRGPRPCGLVQRPGRPDGPRGVDPDRYRHRQGMCPAPGPQPLRFPAVQPFPGCPGAAGRHGRRVGRCAEGCRCPAGLLKGVRCPRPRSRRASGILSDDVMHVTGSGRLVGMVWLAGVSPGRRGVLPRASRYAPCPFMIVE